MYKSVASGACVVSEMMKQGKRGVVMRLCLIPEQTADVDIFLSCAVGRMGPSTL